MKLKCELCGKDELEIKSIKGSKELYEFNTIKYICCNPRCNYIGNYILQGAWD